MRWRGSWWFLSSFRLPPSALPLISSDQLPGLIHGGQRGLHGGEGRGELRLQRRQVGRGRIAGQVAHVGDEDALRGPAGVHFSVGAPALSHSCAAEDGPALTVSWPWALTLAETTRFSTRTLFTVTVGVFTAAMGMGFSKDEG